MTSETNTAVYTDFSGLAALRRDAKQDPDGALRAVAQQFEAIFMQMVLKSMRDASMGDSLFDSDQGNLYRDMFDSQISMNLSEKGGLGIAEALVRQLGGKPADKAESSDAQSTGSLAVGLLRDSDRVAKPLLPTAQTRPLIALERTAAATDTASTNPQTWFEEPLQFVRAVWGHAQRAASALGTVPEVLVAQAALETGWGQHMMTRADGGSAHNLFGIKADERWSGERVTAQTLEFRSGVMDRERATFRAYGSLGESFSDYVRFLKTNPRYRQALAEAGDPERFVAGLQRAGYATDPEYASKINNILSSDTLREALGALNL